MEFEFDKVFNPADYLYFYEQILTSQRLQDELNFLVKYTHLDQPMDILDIGCGFGRHTNALATFGHRVTGLDTSRGFLNIAKEEAKKLNVNVHYIQGDMRYLNLDQTFDRVYALFTTLGYFSDMDNEKIFQNIYQALRPGGFFCFDTHNRDAFLTYFVPHHITEREDNFMLDQTEFDTLTGRSKTKRTIIRDQKRESYDFSVRFYNPTEIRIIFEKIGFSSVHFYEGWTGTQLKSLSKRMVIVATK